MKTLEGKQELLANQSALPIRDRALKKCHNTGSRWLEDQAVMLTVWTNVSEVIQKCDNMASRGFVGTDDTIDRCFFGCFRRLGAYDLDRNETEVPLRWFGQQKDDLRS
jgi:hypothetical protein